MLLESDWIRTQRPLHNRRPKTHADAVTLRPAADSSGRVRLQRIDTLEAEDIAQSFGVFHSEKDARKALTDIARAQQLCLKVLGWRRAPGPASPCRSKMPGACTGREPLILHNMRVQLALSALKIRSWPFPAASRCANGRRRFCVRWNARRRVARARSLDVLGFRAIRGRSRRFEHRHAYAAFDVDVYRILQRYFSNHPNLDWLDLRDVKIPTCLERKRQCPLLDCDGSGGRCLGIG